jgi:UDP-N-acetylglucosamine 2-epimerase (non-hydrolysing)
MPEEINRLITDAISDVLFCTEQSGVDNLRREGVPEKKIHFVGNVMIDTLLHHRAKADQSTILDTLALSDRGYAVITLHRPANVDNRENLEGLIGALERIQTDLTVVFPVHPRTRAKFEEFGMLSRLAAMSNLRILDPIGYLDFLKLIASAKFVLTDSGGIQEETTILKVPCLTLRDNTERPITLEIGSNRLVGSDPSKIIAAYREIMANESVDSKTPPLWDGRAAERIVEVLLRELSRG